MGTNLLRIAQNAWSEWLLRRVETVEFVDYATVRRRVEVHIDLGYYRANPDSWRTEGAELLVPVAWLSRGVHTPLAVTDASGRLQPRLTRGEERDLMGAALTSAAQLILGRPPTHGTLADLHAIINAPPSASESTEDYPTQWDPVPEALRLAYGCSEKGRLGRSNDYFALVAQLHELFLLLLPIDPNATPERRVVLRYDYLEPATFDLDASLRQRLRRLARPNPTLVWVLDVAAADHCRSYHLDVIAPYDLALFAAELIAVVAPDDPNEDDDASVVEIPSDSSSLSLDPPLLS